ncbi:MAG: glycoside hydrolase family 65 protein, partial [Chitinivibrionales bacterium]|nr:glycoside hydrolase family 65 protein [Chitinivibrionales bacterium]
THPDKYETLAHRTGLDLRETRQWQKAADKMSLPFNDELGIHPQDDGFLDKEPWDLDKIPPEKFPLLLHYHPLVIYRHQVIKQADVVLALFLLGDEFSLEGKRRNFDYYDKLTTGDSSLSVSIQSIIAFELGDVDKAAEYLRYAMMMDLGDIGGNVKSGLHMASMGGTWMAIVNGIAGMRDYGGRLSFRPRLPRKIRAMRFPLTVQGRRIEVHLEHDMATYTLLAGRSLTITHFDQVVKLTGKEPKVTVDLEPRGKTAPRAGKSKAAGGGRQATAG